MSFHMSAAEIATAGGNEKKVFGSGEVNSSGTITLRKILDASGPRRQVVLSAPAKGPMKQAQTKAAPAPGHNPVARKFLPQSDILVTGLKPWMKNHRQHILGPRPGRRSNRFSPLKAAMPEPPRPAAAPEAPAPTVTLAIKDLPYRPALHAASKFAMRALRLNID
jgi:hypothetical protein